ncbi:MAG: asparagine synthase (glutamine-hydrolyzing) [Methylocystis sp.]
MCGIVGYFGDLTLDVLRGMAADIAHRGPDGEGIWIDSEAGIGLAHRRLSIIDTSSAAAQPMESCEGRYQVIFNGEIYNFQVLGDELRRRGYSFNANSDTAILGPLYDLLGPAMLERLGGIFAFAIWDREKRELFVARDGLGVKPLYYARLPGGGVAFASELKALTSVPSVGAGLDFKALSDYLTYLWSPGERTLLRDVRKLPPGHFFRADRSGFVITPWHERVANQDETLSPATTRDLVSRLGSLIDEVVGDQCLSDVPIGAFLSGGVDSSAVVASMVATGHAPRQTYCIGFDGEGMSAEGFDDDLVHAREVARRLGVPLTPVIVAPPTGDDLESLVYMLDEPEADPAALYVAEISKASRADGVKVLLGGVGGDDVFSGYRRHKAAALRARTPRGVADFLGPLLKTAASMSGGPLSRRLGKLSYMLDGSDEDFLVKAFEFNPRSAALECLGSDVLARLSEDETDWLEAACERSKGRPLVERMLDLEMRGFLPDHNLNYTDKAGMAHGVEVRVPLLDQRLLDFASLVPWRLKTTLTEEKWILKQAVASRLPSAVLTRKKTGFGAPVRLWVAGRLRGAIEDILDSRSFGDRGIFDPIAVKRILNETIQGHRDGAYLILAIALVELWCRRFIDRPRPASRVEGGAPLNERASAPSLH